MFPKPAHIVSSRQRYANQGELSHLAVLRIPSQVVSFGQKVILKHQGF